MPTRDDAWPAGTPCWVDAMVEDVPRATEFYKALFGWQIFDSGPNAGGYQMCYLNDRAVAGIGQKPQGSPGPSVWTTYLATDDVQATADKVTAAGGSIMAPPMDVMDVGKMAIVADSTGAFFGLWQALQHKGVGVFNENNSLVWNELHTADYAGAKQFYSDVFGVSFTEIGDGNSFKYSTFTVPSETVPSETVPSETVPSETVPENTKSENAESCGAVMGDDNLPPGHPPYWLAWFGCADVDDTVTQATSLGSNVFMQPTDTPFGRMAIVQGPQKEAFGLIDMSKRSDPSAG